MIRKEIIQEIIESQRKWILEIDKGVYREKISSLFYGDSL